MSKDNHGSQSGDGGINVGIGDFRGSRINIGGPEKPTINSEKMKIVRHPVLGGRSLKSGSLTTFGVVTGIASLAGLYLTLFSAFPQPKYSSWSALFLFLFAIATMSVVISVVLNRKRFEHFLWRKHYLESGTRGGLYLNRFTATCPWCSEKMNLRNVGPKNGPRDDMFICERNPKQHTVILDPTILPEIEER